MGPIRKKWPKTASNTLYRLKTWVQSRHRENLKSNEEYRGSMPFSYPHFRPFEGVLGPIGPIFWAQVIWGLAPMALVQKKRVKST